LGELYQLGADITKDQLELGALKTQQNPPPVPKVKPTNGRASYINSQQPQFSYDWDNEIDSQLQGALDALSELTGDEASLTKSDSKSDSLTSSVISEGGLYASSETSSQTGTIKRQPGNVNNNINGKDGNKKTPVTLPRHEQKGNVGNNNNRLSTGAFIPNGSSYQNFDQDLSPVSVEIDSAFSETVSLPSSGSHNSLATSGSQNSSSGAGSGGSGMGHNWGSWGSRTSSQVGGYPQDVPTGPPVSPVSL
jgi:hypothetical protein